MGSSHSNPPASNREDCCILTMASLLLFINEGANESADPMKRASRRESRCRCVIVMVCKEMKVGSWRLMGMAGTLDHHTKVCEDDGDGIKGVEAPLQTLISEEPLVFDSCIISLLL